MIGPVLDDYPREIRELSWRCLDSSGGLSGARIWQGIDGRSPRYALKCWPREFSETRLAEIHLWIDCAVRTNDCPFVPRIIRTLTGGTTVTLLGHVWDLMEWCPGAAAFDQSPQRRKLAVMIDALAKLHRAWEPAVADVRPAPGILRRLRVLQECSAAADGDQLSRRATAILREYVPRLWKGLVEWSERALPIQPCHCDPRHDHWLFEGEKLTGLIDYGAAKYDSPAIDLARCLGDTVCEHPDLFYFGEEHYHHLRGRRDFPEALTRLLAATTTVGAVIGWLQQRQRLFKQEQKPGHTEPSMDLVLAEQRLKLLVVRLETSPVFRELLT